ncbi:hypothetical protein [Micromonospora sp. NPDC126480]|uniref:hypothetical protein n=1 Tax=Micromonospora sp. NPDC126480 TaxID=3155312 RepID=UPI00332849C8
MRRRERWWRPAASTRPGTRTRRRARMVSEDQAARSFELGYELGQRDERKHASDRDDMLRRLADACEDGPDALTALAREVGVMPADDGAQLVDEVERWLREQ